MCFWWRKKSVLFPSFKVWIIFSIKIRFQSWGYPSLSASSNSNFTSLFPISVPHTRVLSWWLNDTTLIRKTFNFKWPTESKFSGLNLVVVPSKGGRAGIIKLYLILPKGNWISCRLMWISTLFDPLKATWLAFTWSLAHVLFRNGITRKLKSMDEMCSV